MEKLTLEEAMKQTCGCDLNIPLIINCPVCDRADYEAFMKTDQFKRAVAELEVKYPQYFNK